MKIAIHGTLRGYTTITPEPVAGLFDARSDYSKIATRGQQAYSIHFYENNVIFSKYKIIRDVLGDSRFGNVAYSLIVPNDEKLGGADVKSLLDRVDKEFSDRYIENNNLGAVRNDWAFLDEIEKEYRLKSVKNHPDGGTAQGAGEAAYIYYAAGEDLEKYFERPYRWQYNPYKQVFFVDEKLKGMDANPLNALKHSEKDDLTETVKPSPPPPPPDPPPHASFWEHPPVKRDGDVFSHRLRQPSDAGTEKPISGDVENDADSDGHSPDDTHTNETSETTDAISPALLNAGTETAANRAGKKADDGRSTDKPEHKSTAAVWTGNSAEKDALDKDTYRNMYKNADMTTSDDDNSRRPKVNTLLAVIFGIAIATILAFAMLRLTQTSQKPTDNTAAEQNQTTAPTDTPSTSTPNSANIPNTAEANRNNSVVRSDSAKATPNDTSKQRGKPKNDEHKAGNAENDKVLADLRSGDISKTKLEDYKKKVTDPSLQENIALALKFWDIDNDDELVKYEKRLNESKKSPNLKDSELHKLVKKIIQAKGICCYSKLPETDRNNPSDKISKLERKMVK